MTERDRTETVVLVLFWVLPLLVVSGLLAAVGLVLIAGSLLAVEAAVALAVLVASRRPSRPAGQARPWVVPAAMVAVLAALVAVTLLAARFG